MRVGPFALLPAELKVVKFASLEEWEENAKLIFDMQKWAPFWLGDLVAHGEARFGDDFWQVPPLGTSQNSLERYVGVCRKIPAESRAKDLSFQHHLLALQVKEPTVRQALLRKAERESMNTEEFGKLIRSM